MRVDSNFTLLKRLGYARESHGIVYCWPSNAARKTPERALRELDWSLLGLWMIQLFAVKEQLAIGQHPAHSSAALAIHAIRDVFHS